MNSNDNKKSSERKRAHLRQVSQLVGVQQQFLQTPSVAVDLIGHVEQRAVAFIDHLDMTVAPPQGYTVKHDGREGGSEGPGLKLFPPCGEQTAGWRSAYSAARSSSAAAAVGCNRLHERVDAREAVRHRNSRVVGKLWWRYRANAASAATTMRIT